jgi:hypothetical protein
MKSSWLHWPAPSQLGQVVRWQGGWGKAAAAPFWFSLCNANCVLIVPWLQTVPLVIHPGTPQEAVGAGADVYLGRKGGKGICQHTASLFLTNDLPYTATGKGMLDSRRGWAHSETTERDDSRLFDRFHQKLRGGCFELMWLCNCIDLTHPGWQIAVHVAPNVPFEQLNGQFPLLTVGGGPSH